MAIVVSQVAVLTLTEIELQPRTLKSFPPLLTVCRPTSISWLSQLFSVNGAQPNLKISFEKWHFLPSSSKNTHYYFFVPTWRTVFLFDAFVIRISCVAGLTRADVPSNTRLRLRLLSGRRKGRMLTGRPIHVQWLSEQGAALRKTSLSSQTARSLLVNLASNHFCIMGEERLT